MDHALYPVAIALSAIGVANSLYFIFAQYGGVSASRGAESGTCKTVLETRYSGVLGVPNSFFGLLFYALVAVVCLVSWRTGSPSLVPYAFVASMLALLVSIYLAHALVYRLRMPCRLCFLSHAINLLLVMLFAVIALER